MRFVLTSGGIQTFISKLESEFLDKHGDSPIEIDKLTMNESYLAGELYRRGVLMKRTVSGNKVYILDKNQGI
jgi:hypothetical protein